MVRPTLGSRTAKERNRTELINVELAAVVCTECFLLGVESRECLGAFRQRHRRLGLGNV